MVLQHHQDRHDAPIIRQVLSLAELPGAAAWPKLWQNLRSTRATELADQFPSHVCAAWLGHTERIANSFYRQVTDEHILRATGTELPVQKPVQHRLELPRTDAQSTCSNIQKTPHLWENADTCTAVHNNILGVEGLEPSTLRV